MGGGNQSLGGYRGEFLRLKGERGRARQKEESVGRQNSEQTRGGKDESVTECFIGARAGFVRNLVEGGKESFGQGGIDSGGK